LLPKTPEPKTPKPQFNWNVKTVIQINLFKSSWVK
jgi:hypothetical protein